MPAWGERKEKTTPLGVSLLRSQVLYRAAHGPDLVAKLCTDDMCHNPNGGSTSARCTVVLGNVAFAAETL